MLYALKRILFRSMVLLVWAFTLTTAQTPPSSPPIPPPGQMVDLGGWRVHLSCTGKAAATQPTVVLEAGAGGFSVDWSLVQPEVSRFARVCSYDRSGLGWSELGPRPRTLRQVVWELHTLLEKAGERPTYVLVAHSAGGVLARLYMSTYPSEVVGMVLVDSGTETSSVVFRDGRSVRLIDTATGQPVPPVKTSDPVRDSDITGNIRSQIEASARQMLRQATAPPYNRLPADAQQMRAWAFSQVKHWATNDNPFEGDELAALLKQRTDETSPLRDMPLVVLSRGQGSDDEHKRNQTGLVNLSRAGKQIIAQGSGHEIMITESELVVTAIRDMITSVRN